MRVPTHHHAYALALSHTYIYAYTRALAAALWWAAYQRKETQP